MSILTLSIIGILTLLAARLCYPTAMRNHLLCSTAWPEFVTDQSLAPNAPRCVSVWTLSTIAIGLFMIPVFVFVLLAGLAVILFFVGMCVDLWPLGWLVFALSRLTGK